MPRQLRHWRSSHFLPVLPPAIGVAVGISLSLLALTSLGPGGRVYWDTSVTVPTGANSTHPYAASFRGATFAMWWPYIPPGSVSTYASGITVQITEPSGVVDETSTGCEPCLTGLQSWYSSDESVGISYQDASGTITLLVEA
jgi:hypothetical protein